jgi:hypothetical protein
MMGSRYRHLMASCVGSALLIDNHLKARISVDGQVSEIHEVSIDEMLAALDETAMLLSEDGAR